MLFLFNSPLTLREDFIQARRASYTDFRAYWGGDERREVCLAVLRPHGQGRHETRQSYGLGLPSLEVFALAGGAYPARKEDHWRAPS